MHKVSITLLLYLNIFNNKTACTQKNIYSIFNKINLKPPFFRFGGKKWEKFQITMLCIIIKRGEILISPRQICRFTGDYPTSPPTTTISPINLSLFILFWNFLVISRILLHHSPISHHKI